MITIRPAEERGQAKLGWLDSRHCFSFGEYHDPKQMGFGPLRVINEDRVQPGAGFDTHGHRDMEIISYVLEGALEHKDSMGNGSIIRPGEVQLMSAGTGVRHSEFNPSPREPVHFLQIWLRPQTEGLEPSYAQKNFAVAERQGKLRLVVAPDGRDGSLPIHQDAEIYASMLGEGEKLAHRFRAGRKGWVQVARGSIDLNDEWLRSGDGAALSDLSDVTITAHEAAELLLFDLP